MNQTFADIVVEKVTPKNRFLDELSKITPWDKIRELLELKIQRSNKGRPSYDLILLFKMLLIKTFFSLSDQETEFHCVDRLSYRKFLDRSIDESIPDATTMEDFRHELENLDLFDELLEITLDSCRKLGYELKRGSLVDATFIRGNTTPKANPEDQSDPDATFGHKGHGYSGHANTDEETKMIKKIHTTTASVPDLDGLEGTLREDDEEAFTDRGYDCEKNWKLLEYLGIEPAIMKKKKPGEELPLFDQLRNAAIAKRRQRVEHVFATWKNIFRFVRTSYRGLKKVTGQIKTVAFAYNLRRLMYLKRGYALR